MAKRASGFTRGFTLIEVVVAIGLLVVLCIGPALGLMFAAETMGRARQQAMAMVLARAKVEQLLSMTWSVRVIGGVPVLLTDDTSDMSRSPPTSTGCGTCASPVDSLSVSREGYVDYVDAQGQWAGAGTDVPGAAAYVRRWSIARSGTGLAEMLIVQVMVTTVTATRRGAIAGVRPSDFDAVWLSGARLRRGG
jgi:prepilin-type N-terminal cleavage/methylation domain-containing protein